MATNSVSRWWYGIATTVVFGVLLYGVVSVFVITGPSQPSSSDGELVLTVVSLAATAVVGFVLYAMTALYVVSFLLDWWYVSKTDSTEWSPSRWYLTMPLAAVGNFLLPVVATPVVTAGGAVYLVQRSRAVGTPGRVNVP